ncbi:MAG: endopeptidase La [Clostridia bacterium]|nr:endopeptidase La [Clostridia bacterium]
MCIRRIYTLEEIRKVEERMPLLPLRGMAAFPNTTLCVDVGRDRSLAALERAMEGDRRLFMVAQRNIDCEQPELADLYSVGTVVRVRHVLPVSEETVRLMCEGERRGLLLEMHDEGHYCSASFAELPSDLSGEPIEMTGYAERVKTLFCLLGQERGRVSGELLQIIEGETNYDTMSNIVAANALRKLEDKQVVLESRSVMERLRHLMVFLQHELELARIEREIEEKTKEHIEQHQRDYYLREQMKVIQEELGDCEEQEAENYRKQLETCPVNDEAREKINREIDRFARMARGTPESTVSQNYIEWLLALPWKKETAKKIDIPHARKVLDADHYGLDKVKERILEYLAVRSMTGEMKGPIICLVGPPGVGKTSIAKSVARALGREFVRVALGGVHDEAEIRGHRRTYIGSTPGRIMTSIRQCGAMDPVFLFDEIDKMASDFRGDPASAMLEALDPAQNATFTDHYLDVPFDLSRVLFITTANSAESIPEPLLDRMELIEVPSYTLEEKVQIAKRHLWGRQLKENGLKRSQLKISEKAIASLIDGYTREAGVRQLERELGTICRKAAVRMLERTEEENAKAISVKPDNLSDFLGVRKYIPDTAQKEPEVGVVNGLAWTQVGGTTMPIEVAVMPGQGAVDLTGRLGDVMKESARTALSYIRSRSKEIGIEPDFHKTNDLHIHLPEGAVPKDGPSAGVALTCAMVSALTGWPARQDVAMTGEVTLRGRVLAIGGVKEKLLAAHRMGIDTILLPKENEKDLSELPGDIRAAMDVHLISQVDQAVQFVLQHG